MGRGGGKAKKHTIVAARDDPADGEEEKQLVYKRRGRPQKLMKYQAYETEEAAVKIEEEDENAKSLITNKDTKDQAAMGNGRKRKMPSQVKEHWDTAKEANGSKFQSGTHDIVKSAGVRRNGNRRKSKPHRAAEVGVGYQ